MGRLHQLFFFSVNQAKSYLSYGIKIWTDLSSVSSQSTRVTGRQTDRILIAIPRLHYMQRGKNRLRLARAIAKYTVWSRSIWPIHHVGQVRLLRLSRHGQGHTRRKSVSVYPFEGGLPSIQIQSF